MLSANLCGDVLAVRCIKEHICIGIGNCVRVYHIATRELVAKLNALRHDNVHSIVEGSANELFVYGGKSLSICEFKVTGDTVNLDVQSVHQFPDWIIAIERASHDNNETQLRILFAHNNLYFYDTTTKLARNARCQEKCILYGGSLLVNNNNRETIVFAGTVFQEILIWQVSDDRRFEDDVAVLHRLKGHSGVIFSVIYNSTNRIISSTSDDRTIRVWRVSNKLDEKSNLIDWENVEINLTTTMYGHTARVWRSIVKNDKILSIGEDSLMCIWTIDGQLLNKIEAHNSAEIWSIDVSKDSKTIFTGGADGAVNVWPFETPDSQKVDYVFKNEEQKIPKHVCYTNNGNICVFMDSGELNCYDPVNKTILNSFNLPRFANYCVMQISPDRKKLGFGSKDGYIEIYEEFSEAEDSKLRKSVEIRAIKSKIFSFHWLSNEMILVCGDRGILKLINTEYQDENLRGEFILPSSRERWTTAAILHDDLLICGDRAGTVYVFKLHDYRMEPSPAQIFSKIHGRLGVQSFAVSGKKILSTGRDGTVRFYEPRRTHNCELLRTLHWKKMPMDWVCKSIKIDGDLYVLGFKEVEFMIYSMNLKRLVQRFICGGGHRSWDCRILSGKMNFVYIRDKQVYQLRSVLCNENIAIRAGFHTKEIYSVKPIVTCSKHNILVSAGEDSALRVSCIDDTKLPIERYRVRTLETYDGHISNVKTLAVINLKDLDHCTKNLVISGGGRAQLKIWQVRVRFDDEILTSYNVTCTELQSYMLRGTDKDRKRAWQSVEAAFFVDPETRFMDISAQIYHQNPRFVVLFLACSDGFLRVLLYDIFANVLHLSNDVNRCNRCTLKVHSFVHKEEAILLSMTTDGFVGFWKMSTCIEKLVKNAQDNSISEESDIGVPFTKMRIHQSGINSFDFQKLDDSRYLLLTGGDDNLLSLIVVEILLTPNESRANRISEWKSSSIHSAQITGAKFIGNNRMLSTGIDQRVILHSYSYDDGVLSVIQIDDMMTFIPDVQGVSLSRPVSQNHERLAFVYGKGLEAIVLDSNSPYP